MAKKTLSGKARRTKGGNNEREIVNALKDFDLEAQRVPLSGAAGGRFRGDVYLEGRIFEAKIRANGFKQLYTWLGDHAGLFLRADRQKTLVVIPLEDYASMLYQLKLYSMPK